MLHMFCYILITANISCHELVFFNEPYTSIVEYVDNYLQSPSRKNLLPQASFSLNLVYYKLKFSHIKVGLQ